MREVLPSDQVALLVHALEQQDPSGEGAVPAAELLRRINVAAAIEQPPFQPVEIDAEVARVLIGAIGFVPRDIGAPDEMRRLLARVRPLVDRPAEG